MESKIATSIVVEKHWPAAVRMTRNRVTLEVLARLSNFCWRQDSVSGG